MSVLFLCLHAATEQPLQVTPRPSFKKEISGQVKQVPFGWDGLLTISKLPFQPFNSFPKNIKHQAPHQIHTCI